MIHYRKATVADALLLCQTRQKAWDTCYRGILPNEMIDKFDYDFHITREQKNLQNPRFHTYLVMDDEECAGYFTYICSPKPLWRDYYFRLLSLYLLPELQKKGLGRRIFLYIAKQCGEMGHQKLYLSCDPQNTNALAFYYHMGCRVVFEDIGHECSYENSIEFEFVTKED